LHHAPAGSAGRGGKSLREKEVRVVPLLLSLLVLALGASLYAAQYLVALPFAPECPACRGVTAHPPRTSALDRLLARGGADARRCPRCGWSGRMRWRLAAERVRRR
jgi:hypothetical protein